MEIKQNEKDNRSKIYLLTLIGILFLFNIGLLYNHFTSKKENKIVVEKLTDEKSDLQKELQAEIEKFDILNEENEGLKGKLATQDAALNEKINQIKVLLKKGNLSDADVKRAKSEIAQLKLDIENYKLKIAELSQKVENLTQENTGLNEELSTEKVKVSDQKKVIESKDRTISIARKLNAGSISAFAVRERKLSGKKEVTTDKASRTEEIKIKFTLDKNEVSESGDKEIFVKLIGPDGAPITSKVQTTKVDGTETLYTEKKTIDYQNDRIDAIVYCKKQGDFTKGTYTVEIFAEGHRIGTSSFILK